MGVGVGERERERVPLTVTFAAVAHRELVGAEVVRRAGRVGVGVEGSPPKFPSQHIQSKGDTARSNWRLAGGRVGV